MNVSRRFFIGSAASFGALGGCRLFTSNGYRDGGTPNLRFGVVSDIHIREVNKGDYRAEPHGGNATFRYTLEWFRDQNVDAVMIAGDMADLGMGEQLMAVAAAWYDVFPNDRYPDGRPVEKVFVYGNHDWHGFGYGGGYARKLYPDEREMVKHILQADMGGWWKKAFHEDYSPLYTKEIKGYTFIGQHWDRGCGYPKGDKGGIDPHTRLAKHLAEHGKSIDPSLPFFYVQHPHPKDTVYGSWAWGHDNGSVTAALSAFPNAVAFSGHSHYSLTDERSVWQGSFTSVGTSSLRYTGMPYNERHPVGYENTTTESRTPDRWKIDAVKMMRRFSTGDCRQGMLWSVYDDCMVVRRREFVTNLDVGDEWVIPLPSAESKPFAFAERAKKFAAPRFVEGGKLQVSRVKAKNRGGKSEDGKRSLASVDKDAFRIDVPPAVADRHARLYELEFVAESKDGSKKTKYVMAVGYNHAEESENAKSAQFCPFSLDELPKGEVRFSVTPMNCFHRRGEPLVSEWMRI